MLTSRPPAVAGLFYPADISELNVTASQLLHGENAIETPAAHALIVPHAGWIYSGIVAAAAYRAIADTPLRRIVIAGPAHRVALRGIAVPSSAAFLTPLGPVKVDDDLRRRALLSSPVQQRDDAHAQEHAIEVQLPLLQSFLDDFTLLPLVVGACPASALVDLFTTLIDDDVMLIISTDLSHFLSYQHAQKTDRDTIEQILSFSSRLQGEQACGAYPLNGFLSFARQRGWQLQCMDYQNSGDTAGSKDSVVGYASFIAH